MDFLQAILKNANNKQFTIGSLEKKLQVKQVKKKSDVIGRKCSFFASPTKGRNIVQQLGVSAAVQASVILEEPSVTKPIRKGIQKAQEAGIRVQTEGAKQADIKYSNKNRTNKQQLTQLSCKQQSIELQKSGVDTVKMKTQFQVCTTEHSPCLLAKEFQQLDDSCNTERRDYFQSKYAHKQPHKNGPINRISKFVTKRQSIFALACINQIKQSGKQCKFSRSSRNETDLRKQAENSSSNLFIEEIEQLEESPQDEYRQIKASIEIQPNSNVKIAKLSMIEKGNRLSKKISQAIDCTQDSTSNCLEGFNQQNSTKTIKSKTTQNEQQQHSNVMSRFSHRFRQLRSGYEAAQTNERSSIAVSKRQSSYSEASQRLRNSPETSQSNQHNLIGGTQRSEINPRLNHYSKRSIIQLNNHVAEPDEKTIKNSVVLSRQSKISSLPRNSSMSSVRRFALARSNRKKKIGMRDSKESNNLAQPFQNVIQDKDFKRREPEIINNCDNYDNSTSQIAYNIKKQHKDIEQRTILSTILKDVELSRNLHLFEEPIKLVEIQQIVNCGEAGQQPGSIAEQRNKQEHIDNLEYCKRAQYNIRCSIRLERVKRSCYHNSVIRTQIASPDELEQLALGNTSKLEMFGNKSHIPRCHSPFNQEVCPPNKGKLRRLLCKIRQTVPNCYHNLHIRERQLLPDPITNII